MKVLISEDDDYKFEKIERSIINTFGADNCEIHRETSVRGTIEYLESNEVDILIQDMNLPIFKSETKVRQASGLSVIYHVHYDELTIKHKFVCSYDSFAEEKYKTEFNECGFKFVHFDPSMSLSGAFSVFEGGRP